MSFLDELTRRNVFRVAIGYLAGAWLLIQILETLFPIFSIPETSVSIVVVIAAIGFVPVLIASWYFEITPEGLKRDSEARQLKENPPVTSDRGSTHCGRAHAGCGLFRRRQVRARPGARCG